jgi:peptidoglycan/xylan/chitin deacetylase (PgdA/CDA1 family)
MYPGICLPALVGVCLMVAASLANAANSGVILLYHHVDGDTPASTSITRREFADQLDYLEGEGFQIVPLNDLVEALRSGRPVAERSVAITFDDAYRTILSGALPELESRGLPFTIFVSTQVIDDAYGAYLSWDELRMLGEHGATIGNHSVSHTHLVRQMAGESDTAWRRRITAEIFEAGIRLEAEVGDYLIPVMAYPYGEYTTDIKTIVGELGLTALAQHSGAIGPGSDFLALPRYPNASDLKLSASDFALRVRSRPLPVKLTEPEEHVVDTNDRPPLRLQLNSKDDLQLDELACYASGQGRMSLQWLDQAMTEFVATPERALGVGRSKYNCTAPSIAEAGVYYWFGYLWMRRRSDGLWYDE